MADKTYSKNLDTFNKVITSLATDAVADVEGISLLGTKRSHGAVSVYFLPNEKVSVDMQVVISQGYTVPVAFAALQENVKYQIERATKYKVHTVNVHVTSVSMEQ